MAQAQTPGFSPLKSLVAYTSQTAGLEKTLRLIQATSQVIGVTTANKTLATQCLTARDQLALSTLPCLPYSAPIDSNGTDSTARRYFRLLDFYACFERVHALITNPSSSSTIPSAMELAQYTFLGLYLFLEDFTILHDMNVARVDWHHALMTEANKFWFYALALSVLRCTWELLSPQAPDTPKTTGGEKSDPKTTAKQTRAPKWPLVKRIIIDGCDLTLPGSFLGWTPVTPLQIGLGMVVSTVFAGHNVWAAQG
ncbi:PEX11 domain protein [Aspergillus mulundensis]|uniref:Putative microbody (Peroxisome) proliferation protein peroxin 11B n=1 Tax=Aspergillus mulundensis TaxID=1810919 RepID=A0A3D8QVK0_9EURO|nr:putative microbody (Peroxisome) proliferation protein peroxin 11B [Aspergillus mulundensis]RDW65805.1 putative microbody (Peroxisome) proliferation protein peroxin 11B [Aspergillus mulundensis]